MRINFTKKQYETLLEMCLLGAYIIEESTLEVDDNYNEFLKYILEFNDNLRTNEKVFNNFNNLASILINNMDFKEEFLAKYNERTFWKELSSRLAARDALEEIGEELKVEDYNKYLKIKNKYEKKYEEQFNIDKYNNIKLPY
ncbi:hypothetical protein [Clostridium tarantellae]|uniref:Uncharacterized protein n=1 Tax=Clostridium tarantellae TaxID=39493 RepID=A0A6I1ML05_9CLOT|nr:hypothetical protein [Clostridium tarantellae]MPQ44085.1 hypothetical protein [Clostridium tarantellae]